MGSLIELVIISLMHGLRTPDKAFLIEIQNLSHHKNWGSKILINNRSHVTLNPHPRLGYDFGI